MTALDTLQGFKWGCDPELFVMNDKGVIVTAEGLIPGTKFEPHPVAKGAVQLDGVAAEFNIDPAEDFTQFNDNIETVLGEMKKILPVGYSLVARPSVVFTEKEWEKTSPESRELGCTPDFDAWTGEVNPPPDGEVIPRMRTGSGHIHIGWRDDGDLDEDHVRNCRDLVKQFDYYLGAWSVNKDTDKRRRELYGKAGACRFKPYGVEYRVLSNFWVLDPKMRLEVWNRCQQGLMDMKRRYLPEKVGRGFNFPSAIVQSINTSNIAPEIHKYFKFPVDTMNTEYAYF